MAEASGDALLPAPLAICCVGVARRLSATDDEAEEKTSDATDITNYPKKLYRTTGEEAAATAASDTRYDSEGDETAQSQRFKRRPANRSPSASSAAAMRSPSRLAASFLVGRDRMARAARALRDGGWRAGLFMADDDFKQDDDDDEHEEKQEKQEWGANRGQERLALALGSTPSVALDSPDGNEERDSTPINDPEENPAKDELIVAAKTSATPIPAQPSCTPRLVPTRLTPATRLPRMAQLWVFLDRIECITIRDVFTTHDDDDSGPTVHYVLDIYNYQEQHSLPTHRYRATNELASRRCSVSRSPPSRRPDYHIEHRFSSFTKLRSRLIKATHLKHPRGPSDSTAPRPPSSSYRHCAYCHTMAVFLAEGNDAVAPLGWKTKFFTTVEMRKALLSRFLSELVFLAREQRAACSNFVTLTALQQPPSTYVHRSVPGILRRFLTVQTGENFMH